MSKRNRDRREKNRAGKLQGPPSSMLVLCRRIGEAGCRIPPGYSHTTCYRCKAAVWISPHLPPWARRMGMKVAPLCNSCTSPLLDSIVP